MTRDNEIKLTEGAEEKQTITLNPEEADKLTIILNLKLRKVRGDVDFFGTRTDATLTQEKAKPLNEVFKQLTGRDHDQYEGRFGSTMSPVGEPVRSNTLKIGDGERRSALRLIDEQLGFESSRYLHPDYRQTLVDLSQKLSKKLAV